MAHFRRTLVARPDPIDEGYDSYAFDSLMHPRWKGIRVGDTSSDQWVPDSEGLAGFGLVGQIEIGRGGGGHGGLSRRRRRQAPMDDDGIEGFGYVGRVNGVGATDSGEDLINTLEKRDTTRSDKVESHVVKARDALIKDLYHEGIKATTENTRDQLFIPVTFGNRANLSTETAKDVASHAHRIADFHHVKAYVSGNSTELVIAFGKDILAVQGLGASAMRRMGQGRVIAQRRSGQTNRDHDAYNLFDIGYMQVGQVSGYPGPGGSGTRSFYPGAGSANRSSARVEGGIFGDKFNPLKKTDVSDLSGKTTEELQKLTKGAFRSKKTKEAAKAELARRAAAAVPPGAPLASVAPAPTPAAAGLDSTRALFDDRGHAPFERRRGSIL